MASLESAYERKMQWAAQTIGLRSLTLGSGSLCVAQAEGAEVQLEEQMLAIPPLICAFYKMTVNRLSKCLACFDSWTKL